MQIPAGAPKFDQRLNTHLVAKFEHGAVSFGDLRQVDQRIAGLVRADGRRRDALAADLGKHVHVPFYRLHARGSAGVIIHDPFVEPDGILNA